LVVIPHPIVCLCCSHGLAPPCKQLLTMVMQDTGLSLVFVGVPHSPLSLCLPPAPILSFVSHPSPLPLVLPWSLSSPLHHCHLPPSHCPLPLTSLPTVVISFPPLSCCCCHPWWWSTISLLTSPLTSPYHSHSTPFHPTSNGSWQWVGVLHGVGAILFLIIPFPSPHCVIPHHLLPVVPLLFRLACT
jgi:hypothetical protein